MHPNSKPKGGYHPTERLVQLLYEIKLEALTAKQSNLRTRRDRAFVEIAELAQRRPDLIEHHARCQGDRRQEARHGAA